MAPELVKRLINRSMVYIWAQSHVKNSRYATYTFNKFHILKYTRNFIKQIVDM